MLKLVMLGGFSVPGVGPNCMANVTTDAQLVRRVQKGDKGAFDLAEKKGLAAQKVLGLLL